jgi:ABC-2 type transport system permease protein
MSARRTVWEVARRELIERSRSRVMQVSVVLLLLLSIAGAVAAARLTGHTPTDQIGLVGARSAALAPAIQLQAKAMGRRARLHTFATAAVASRALRSGTVSAAVIDGTRILVKSKTSQPSVRIAQEAAATQGVLDRLLGTGLTGGEALAVMSPRPLTVAALEANTRNTDRNRGLIVAGLLALFTILVFYGQAVAQGVTEEKSSRVVELLLTSVTPRRLLAGKVLGIGLLGLAQLVLAGAAALVAGQLAGGAGLPSAAPTAVALVVLWFILGYAFYSVAFAAVGALVSRQEDLSTAIVPITLVMTGSFYLALIVANGNPNGTVAQIAAFVPPLSPMVVPARMVLGDLNVPGLALAIAVDLLATAGLILLAARIYERAILRIGAPVKLRRLFGLDAERRNRPDVPLENDHRLRRFDLAGRIAAIALLLGGAATGLNSPIGITLIAAGVLLVLVVEHHKRHHPSGRAH